MTPQNLEIEIIYDDQAKKSWGRLLLKSKNSTIESVLQAPTTELKEIEKTMAAYYEPKQK